MFKGYREYRAFKKLRKQSAHNFSAKIEASEQNATQYLSQQVSELTAQLETIKGHLGIYLWKNPGRYEVREVGKNNPGGGIGMAMQAETTQKKGN